LRGARAARGVRVRRPLLREQRALACPSRPRRRPARGAGRTSGGDTWGDACVGAWARAGGRAAVSDWACVAGAARRRAGPASNGARCCRARRHGRRAEAARSHAGSCITNPLRAPVLSAAALVRRSRTRPEPPALPHTAQSIGRRGHCRPILTLMPWGISGSGRSAGEPYPPSSAPARSSARACR